MTLPVGIDVDELFRIADIASRSTNHEDNIYNDDYGRTRRCECDDKYRLHDEQCGDLICSNCGLILEERTQKNQAFFDGDEKLILQESSKDQFFENKTISTVIGTKRIRKGCHLTGLARKIHVQSSVNQKQAYRMSEFGEIDLICEKLMTTANISNDAKHFFNDLCKVKTYRGINRKAMKACCILRSLTEHKAIRSTSEVLNACKLPKKALTKNINWYQKLIGKKIVNESSSSEIYRYLQSMGVEQKSIFKISNEVIERQKQMFVSDDYQGKSPKILYAIILKSLGFEKKRICSSLKVSLTAF